MVLSVGARRHAAAGWFVGQKFRRKPISTCRMLPTICDGLPNVADRRLPFGDAKFTWLVRLNAFDEGLEPERLHLDELRQARIEPEVAGADVGVAPQVADAAGEAR